MAYGPRWLFGIGTILLLVTVAAAMAAYAWRRAAAIAYAESLLGNSVRYGRLGWWPEGHPAPKWLRPVEEVEIDPRVPCELRRLAPLAELEVLSAGEIDPAGVKSLACFTRLRSLSLLGPNISDATMAEIARCKRVTWLDLAKTSVSDEHVKALEGLPLTYLDVGSGVGDAGIDWIVRIPSLSMLHLKSPDITDAGVAKLARLGGLTCLSLRSSHITDAGVSELTALPLTMLWLQHTGVTDASLPALARLPLKQLSLQHTPVTPEGLRALAQKTLITVGVSTPPFTKQDEDTLRASGIPVFLDPKPARR